jgi:hypothetical protein
MIAHFLCPLLSTTIAKFFIAKTADPSSRPKNDVMFSCQNIQECAYVPDVVKWTIWKGDILIGPWEIVIVVAQNTVV